MLNTLSLRRFHGKRSFATPSTSLASWPLLFRSSTFPLTRLLHGPASPSRTLTPKHHGSSFFFSPKFKVLGFVNFVFVVGKFSVVSFCFFCWNFVLGIDVVGDTWQFPCVKNVRSVLLLKKEREKGRKKLKNASVLKCRISLTFWDELAHVAFQHVEKGQEICVSGRLVTYTVESDKGKRQTYFKV